MSNTPEPAHNKQKYAKETIRYNQTCYQRDPVSYPTGPPAGVKQCSTRDEPETLGLQNQWPPKYLCASPGYGTATVPVYHVETPRPFISPTLPYVGMHPINFL